MKKEDAKMIYGLMCVMTFLSCLFFLTIEQFFSAAILGVISIVTLALYLIFPGFPEEKPPSDDTQKCHHD